jgi:hypothetical protein
MKVASPTVPTTRRYWGHIVPGLQTGPSTSMTRAVCVPGHHDPPNPAGLSATVTGSPLVAAGTGTVRSPMQPPAAVAPLRPRVKPSREDPAAPEEAGAMNRAEKRVVAPPWRGDTVSPDPVVAVVGAVVVVGVLGVDDAVRLVPAPAELDAAELDAAELEVAEPQPAAPRAPPTRRTARQPCSRALGEGGLIARSSLRAAVQGFRGDR